MRLLLRPLVLAGVAVGLLAGCGPHQPLDDQPPQHGEIAPGPGVFTGADGKFDLLGGSKKKRTY